MESFLTIEHYTAIGQIAVAGSGVEGSIRLMLAYLVNKKHLSYGLIMARKLNARPMIELLIPILKYSLSKSQFERVKKILGRAKKLMEQRNKYIHSIWEYKIDDDEYFDFGERIKLKLENEVLDIEREQIREIPPAKLRAVADGLSQVAAELSEIIELIRTRKRKRG